MHSVLEPIHILPYTFFFHPIRLYVRSCSCSYSNCLHCWRTFSALSFVLIVVLHGITRHGKSSENKQTNKRKNISKQHEYNRPSTDVHCTLYNVVMCMIFHVLILATTLTTTINVANKQVIVSFIHFTSINFIYAFWKKKKKKTMTMDWRAIFISSPPILLDRMALPIRQHDMNRW